MIAVTARNASRAFGIQLALAVIGWLIWKPLAGIFVIIGIGGIAREISVARASFWARRAVIVVALLYGALMAVVVRYGLLIWGDGLTGEILLGLVGLNGVWYVSYGAEARNLLDENRQLLSIVGSLTYILLALLLFLLPLLVAPHDGSIPHAEQSGRLVQMPDRALNLTVLTASVVKIPSALRAPAAG